MLQVFGKYFVQFSPFLEKEKTIFCLTMHYEAVASINLWLKKRIKINYLYLFGKRSTGGINLYHFQLFIFVTQLLLFFIGRTEKQNSKECFKFYQSLQMINRTACSLVLHSREEKWFNQNSWIPFRKSSQNEKTIFILVVCTYIIREGFLCKRNFLIKEKALFALLNLHFSIFV